MRKIITILCSFFLFTSALGGSKDHYDHSVSDTITALMQRYQIPGAAVGIVDHNKSYIYVLGVANKSNNVPVTNRTIFEVGSVTKLFTALLFVAAADDRRQLYDPLTKYYPELNKNPYLKKITMEELLTYTSGLPFTLPENITTLEQAQNYFLQWQPTNPIGTQWQYSNVGIGLVGIALQNKEHKSIFQLYKQHILNKLNMTSTNLEVYKQFEPYFAQGYKEDGKTAPHSSIGLFPAAGDLKASIQDMSKFLAVAAGLPGTPLNLRQGMKNTQIPRLEIGAGTQQGLVWQIHSLRDKNLLNEPEKMDLGPLPVKQLAKKQQVFDDNKLIDKTGATEGFRAYVAVIPSRQLGIVILLNKYIPNGAIVNTGRKIMLEKL